MRKGFIGVALAVLGVAIAIGLAGSAVISILNKPKTVGSFFAVQAQRFILAGGGISLGDVTIKLTQFKLPDASTTITMANFGSKGYGTLEPGTSKEEQISFTGVTQNGDGTAVLTGVTRGLNFVSPYQSLSANIKAHAGGSVFVISNTAAFYSNFLNSLTAQTINAIWTFASDSIPITNTNATSVFNNQAQFVTKSYVDSVAIQGSPNASYVIQGLSQLANQLNLVQGTATSAPNVYLVAPSQFFNATSSATTSVPVADFLQGGNYKLSPGWIATSSPYTWGATTTFSANVLLPNIANSSALVLNSTGTIIGVSASSTGNVLMSDGTNWQSLPFDNYAKTISHPSTTMSVLNGVSTTLVTTTMPTPNPNSWYKFVGLFKEGASNTFSTSTLFVTVDGTTLFQCDLTSLSGNFPMAFSADVVMNNSLSSETTGGTCFTNVPASFGRYITNITINAGSVVRAVLLHSAVGANTVNLDYFDIFRY